MDREKFSKAKTVDFSLSHINRSIREIEEGYHVFAIEERHQNVIDRDKLREIQKEAEAKVLEILYEQKSELEKEFAEI